MKVMVLGASGMLGSMVLDYLARDVSLTVGATVRDSDLQRKFQASFPAVEWHLLDAASCNVDDISVILRDTAWVINAIGVIKPYIHDDNPGEVERATRVNVLFPHLLARAAEQNGCRVLQIATDCVYSGIKGSYVERDSHDPLDVYGKTKSLGEVYSTNVSHLRCSIIGPERKGHVSLLDWFLRQPQAGTVNGYTNHQWNGVTTLHFARLCHGIITHQPELPHVQHIIPSGAVSKCELLQCFASEYQRGDIAIIPAEAKTVVDRTLSTINDALNQQLWAAAGYATLPTVPQMVAELAQYDYHLNGA